MSLVDYPSAPRTFTLHGPGPVQRKPLPKPQSTAQAEQSYLPAQQHSSQHKHSRTASSSIFPVTDNTPLHTQPSFLPPQPQIPQNTNAVSYQAHMNQPNTQQARRTPSTATSLASGSSSVPMRQNSGSSLARSASSRSGNSQTSYVALMRKQKATVWSDRAQHEDPRLLAQQRAAKMRAAAEVQNAALNARTSNSASSSSLTGGVRSKILHHGAARARDYVQTGLPQSGVPMRLSQNEIDENEEDEDLLNGQGIHRRTDSGRSSLGSAGRVGSMYGLQGYNGTPPSGLQTSSPVESRTSPRMGSEDETPIPADYRQPDYFTPHTTAGKSPGAGSDESQFGELGKLPLRTRTDDGEEKLSAAELRRRGSVDERTMTMSGYGKLFIANPDA